MSDPYLRTVRARKGPRPMCPPGHETARVGMWNGKPTEAVFDPKRHEVLCIRGHVSEEVISGLQATGWELHLTDGVNDLWVRDRSATARASLDRTVTRLRRSTPRPPRIA